MGRVVVVNFCSIDGVIQSPLSPEEDGDGGFDRGGWVPPLSDDVVDAFMEHATVQATGLLLGRRSYEILRAAWADADPSIPAIAAMNRMPKHVVTSSPLGTPWHESHVVGGELAVAIPALAAATEGDLVVLGSGALVRGLAAADLVDEYRVLLFPVVLGEGKRMFGDGGRPARFRLGGSVATPGGVVIVTWVRDRLAGGIGHGG